MTRKGKIPTQTPWVRAGAGKSYPGQLRECVEGQRFKHTPILTRTPLRGQTALRQQVKSRGQGPTWGSVKPKNPGSFSARGQEVKKNLLQPVEEREEVGLPGGPRSASLQTALGLRLWVSWQGRISVAGLPEDHRTSGGPTSEYSLPLWFSNTT